MYCLIHIHAKVIIIQLATIFLFAAVIVIAS